MLDLSSCITSLVGFALGTSSAGSFLCLGTMSFFALCTLAAFCSLLRKSKPLQRFLTVAIKSKSHFTLQQGPAVRFAKSAQGPFLLLGLERVCKSYWQALVSKANKERQQANCCGAVLTVLVTRYLVDLVCFVRVGCARE